MTLSLWLAPIGTIISVISFLRPGAVNNNPEAAKELDSTLSKLVTHYEKISETLDKLTTIPLDDPARLNEAKRFLRSVTDGTLRRELEAAGARCKEIGLAYDTHLQRWFTNWIQPDLQEDLKEIFDELRCADKKFIGSLGNVADYAEKKAPALLALIEKADASSLSEAKRAVDLIERDVWENKVVLNVYLAQLRTGQKDFLETISGSSQ